MATDMLTRTGLGGRRQKAPIDAMRDGLGFQGEAASAWAVVERYLKGVSVAQDQSGTDVLSTVEAGVIAATRKVEAEVVAAVAKLRGELTPEQRAILAGHVCDLRVIAAA